MMKIFTKFFLIIFLFVTLLVPIWTFPVDVRAQSATPSPTVALTNTLTPSPSTNVNVTPTPVVLTNQNVVTFSQFQRGRADNITLDGPFDSRGFGFVLPANWQLTEGIELNLQYGVSFNTEFQGESDVVFAGGGTLNVFLNNTFLLPIPLNKVGDVETRFTIPSSIFEVARTDGVNVLSFTLESYESCRFFGQNTTVFIYPTSYLTLPHNLITPSTSLLNFPRPIYQNSFEADQALIVVPDQPSAAELQAVLTTAAGLGKLSANSLILDLTTVSNMQNKNFANTHLILIGKSLSLPNLGGLNLPLPVVDGKFQPSSDSNIEAGIIQMVDSPWSDGPHVVLIVSGDTEEGLIKAAQAISTGTIRPNRVENLSIVDQINLNTNSNLQPVDRTLADLGYSNSVFENGGSNSEIYVFNIPAGTTISSTSYFELVYGHSALLDYNNSQIIVSINDQPIGSVRMSDDTAKLPTNRVKFMIPPSVVQPGENILDVVVNLVPIDECSPENLQGLWANIWEESNLHLPQIATSLNPLAIQDLSTYPAPFNYDSFLSNTAFILERGDYASWVDAVKIAQLLGWQSNGSLLAFSAFYGDDVPASILSNYNLLVVGRPSQLPIVMEMNANLPAPFDIGSDIANESGGFQVTYRIPPDSPMGYLEMLQSPWNPSNIVLAILGNTLQGVNWATNALVDPSLSWRLGGNFAVVNGEQIITTNSITFANLEEEISQQEISTPITVGPGNTNPDIISTSNRPAWVLPLIVILAIILAVVIGIVVRNFVNYRVRSKTEK